MRSLEVARKIEIRELAREYDLGQAEGPVGVPAQAKILPAAQVMFAGVSATADTVT